MLKRAIGHDFEDYKKQRTAENKRIKQALKGRLIFKSTDIGTHPKTKLAVVMRPGRTYVRSKNKLPG